MLSIQALVESHIVLAFVEHVYDLCQSFYTAKPARCPLSS